MWLPFWATLAILVFAGASFFFALAESALFSLTTWQKRRLMERAPRQGGIVVRLLDTPQDLLASILLGGIFANAAMVAIALWVALRSNWPAAAIAVAFAVLLIGVLLGCESIPKTLGVRAPERAALWVARPMLIFQGITLPFRRVAQALNAALLKPVLPANSRPEPALSEEEYQELLDLAFQQGTLAETERDIILRIIRLDRRTAGDVMRPRAQMASISDDLPVEQMIAEARKFKHRRLPLHDETPDTIVGVLNTRALLLNPSIDLAEAIEFPSFVPESMNLLQLFKSLQRQQRGLAIVLDEFGGTAGLVTLEDILEEIVGEIRGEGEEGGFVVEKLGRGRWRVNGTMRLDDFRREYPGLGEVTDVDTMGGLLVAQIQVVPRVGDSAVFRGLKLTATVADERRVRELVVETAGGKEGG